MAGTGPLINLKINFAFDRKNPAYEVRAIKRDFEGQKGLRM
jgi:hypothetical protein